MSEGPRPGGLGNQPGNDGQPAGWLPPPPPFGYGQQPLGYGAHGGAYGGASYGAYGGGPGQPRAPKPGIIPLRPLSVGDMLGGAFTALRWNPKAILVPSAVLGAISGVMLTVLMFFMEKDMLAQVSLPATGQPVTSQQWHNFLVPYFKYVAAFGGATIIFTFVTSVILTGILTIAIGQGVLGRKMALSSVLGEAVLARVGPLLATLLLAGLIISVGLVAAICLSVGIAVLLADVAHLVAIGVLAGVLVALTAIVFAVIIAIRWSLATPVVMLERLGPMASLARSWRLVRGSAWRVLGITLLTNLIFGLIGGVIRAPFMVAGGAGAFGGAQLHPTVVNTVASGVGMIVASTVTAPLTAGIVVLLYADLRMRKEGMAERLQAAAAQQAAPGAPEPPSPW